MDIPKQTPFVDILRLHAEDLHSARGHNKSARLLSQAADEIERIRAENARLIAALNLITAHYDASDRQIALAEAALAAKESHP